MRLEANITKTCKTKNLCNQQNLELQPIVAFIQTTTRPHIVYSSKHVFVQ